MRSARSSGSCTSRGGDGAHIGAHLAPSTRPCLPSALERLWGAMIAVAGIGESYGTVEVVGRWLGGDAVAESRGERPRAWGIGCVCR